MGNFSLMILMLIFLFLISCSSAKKSTLYLVGDSTVKSGEGKGENNHWGCGDSVKTKLKKS